MNVTIISCLHCSGRLSCVLFCAVVHGSAVAVARAADSGYVLESAITASPGAVGED